MSSFLQSLSALGSSRLIALAGVAATVIGGFTVLNFIGSDRPMSLLYGDLDLREAAQMSAQLDAAKVQYETRDGGTELLVAEPDIDRARLLLARQGLPSGGSVGYEIFDKAGDFTASAFEQRLNQTRALEGELARTIRTIVGVRAARVHLVLPNREPFQREEQDAQASVLLTLAGPGRLDTESVQAVLNLVAAAVPGLRQKNVSIVDSRGNVLSRAGESSSAASAVQSFEDLKQATELRLAHAVEEMLARSLGPSRVRAEVAIDYDVSQMHETQEKFDPDGQVQRSTQTVSDNTKTTEAPPSVSVQNNLPNADASLKEGGGSQEQRQEETTNFEVSKTVRTIVREQPEIRRLSVAVLVDGETSVGPDGRAAWKPRSSDDMSRIAALVRSAIGYDEKRGDKVEVVNMRFAAEDVAAPPLPAGLFGLSIGAQDLASLLRAGIIGVISLIGLLVVIRPTLLRLATPRAVVDQSSSIDDALLSTGAVSALVGPGPSEITSANSGAGAEPGERMIDVANVEGLIRASSINQVAELVERHSDMALSVVRAWMVEGAA